MSLRLGMRSWLRADRKVSTKSITQISVHMPTTRICLSAWRLTQSTMTRPPPRLGIFAWASLIGMIWPSPARICSLSFMKFLLAPNLAKRPILRRSPDRRQGARAPIATNRHRPAPWNWFLQFAICCAKSPRESMNDRGADTMNDMSKRASLRKPIPFIDLQAQRRRLGPAIDDGMQRVLAHGQFIMGPEVAELERALA